MDSQEDRWTRAQKSDDVSVRKLRKKVKKKEATVAKKHYRVSASLYPINIIKAGKPI